MAIEKNIESILFWEDSQYRLIPKDQVKITDQARDELIEELVEKWKTLKNGSTVK